MKKMLLAILLFLILSGYTLPQNIIFEAPETKYRQSDIYPAEFVNSLNKTPSQKGGAYKPLKVTVDSNLKLTFTYDSNWNLSSFSEWHISDNAWREASKDVYTYDEKGNLLIHLVKVDWGSGPKDYNIEYYIYDGSNRLTMIIDSSLHSSAVRRTLYTYDDKGRILTNTFQSWLNDAWVNTDRSSYSYDSSGNRVSGIMEVWSSTGWVNLYKSLYNYDKNNKPATIIDQRWENNKWQTYARYTYTWDDNGRNTLRLNETYLSAGWKNIFRQFFTYNSNGDMTCMTREDWADSIWTGKVKTNFYYDDSRNCTNVSNFLWRRTGWAPGDVSGLFTYNGGMNSQAFPLGAIINIEYAQTTGVDEEAAITKSFSLEQNYPNPFNPSTTINYSTGREGMVRLTVYDALGRMAAVIVNENKPAGSYSVKFDGSRYPSGVYFYRLESGGMTLSRKFVLIK